MKVPTTPTVRVQTAGRAYEAGRVVPQENPYGRSAQEFGGALEAAGHAALRVEDILQERVDRAKAREADAKLADVFREKLTAPGGFLTTEGRATIDGRADFLKQIDTERQNLLDTLSPRQRELIADSDESRYQHTRNAIDGHYARQVDAYDLSEREARAGSLAQDAVASYFMPANPTAATPAQDPQKGANNQGVGGVDPGGDEPEAVKRAGFEDNRIAALAEIEGIARRKGLGPEATKSAVAKMNDQIHGAIMSQLVDKGRALEAADYLARYEKDMTPLARARVEKTIHDGGVKEQAQALSVWLRPQGTVMEQVAVLDELHSKKNIPLEVRDEAERRLLHNASVKNSFQAAEGRKALEEAQIHMQLPANRGKSISQDQREKLRTFGQEGAFDLWIAQGGQFITTNNGLQRVQRVTDEELGSKYATADELLADYQNDLNPDDQGKLVLRWKKARGEKLNPQDAEALDANTHIKAFLFGKGFFAKFVDSDDKEASRRLAAFESAVVSNMPTLSGKGMTPREARKLAMESVYSENPITVDGKVMPAVMATPAELERATIKTNKGVEVQTFLMGRPPGGGTDGQEINTTAPLVEVGSDPIDLRPKADADRLPTRLQTIDALVALKKPATEGNIAQFYLDARAEIEQRAKDAQRIATTENKLRAKALLDRLPYEVEKEFSRRSSVMLRTRTQSGQLKMVSSSELAGITPKEEFRAALVSVLNGHYDELRRYGLTHAQAAQWVPDAKKMLPQDDELLTVEGNYGHTGIPFSQFFTFRVPITTKVDPSPTPEEIAEADALRKKYQKTEVK